MPVSMLGSTIFRDNRASGPADGRDKGPFHSIVSDRTINSLIKKLRKKIAAVSSGQGFIHSVYGVGYKFERD